MRLSVQVWTPYFWKSPYDYTHARDFSRALSEWHGESRVYLDPNAKEVFRWKRMDQNEQVCECVIPSETINSFIVTHIDGQGRIFPYLPLPEEWHNSVSGAYTKWLQESAILGLIDSEYTQIPMPIIKDGRVSIVDAKIKIVPSASVPITDFTDEGVFTAQYSSGRKAKMLSPDHEVKEIVGKSQYRRQVVNGKEWLFTVSEKDPTQLGLSTQIGWKEPFNYMLGEGGGVDLMMHQGIFKRCISELNENQSDRVIKEAETWLDVLTSVGKSFLWHSWFAPMAQANQEEALFAVESRYDISANSVDELFQSNRFGRIMNTSVDVIVAHDWLGYMWWDFYQDLREKTTIRCCEACGRIIRGGHHDRRFCNRVENPDCFRKRNTINQRRKRTHKP